MIPNCTSRREKKTTHNTHKDTHTETESIWEKKGKTDMPIKCSNLLSSHPATQTKSEYHK